MTSDLADNPICQQLEIAAYIISHTLRQRGASDAEIKRAIADLARGMERSGST